MNVSLLRPWARQSLTLTLLCSAMPVVAEPLSEAEAIRRALASPAVSALDSAERDVAAANTDTVRRFENPELSVSRERVSGTLGSETEWQVGVQQTIGLNGAQSSLRRAAESEAQAVGADIARRRDERVAAVRTAYAQCRAASDRLGVFDDHISQLARIERAIGLRAKAGDAAVYDLRRVRLELRSVEAKRALAQGELQAACATLAAFTNTADARASEPLALVAPTGMPGAETRADLEARRYRIESAGNSADAARRRQLPDLTVGAGYKRIQEGGGSAGGPAISLGVRVPIFNNGSAERRAAEARRSALEAELALAQANLDAERRAAAARADAAFEAAKIAAKGSDDAGRVASTAEAAYQGGETDITDLVDGYRAASEARIEAVDLAERAATARTQLDLAKGGMIP